MTVFVIVCAAMLLAALIAVGRPLLKASGTSDGNDSSRTANIVIAIVVAVFVSATSVLVYRDVGGWKQQAQLNLSNPGTTNPEVKEMVGKLEQRLQQSPNDIEGWLLLGRSYATLEQPQAALNAYQKAYDLSGGKNVEATLGAAEFMVALDERTIAGRAGELFEAALAQEPDNAKALWYGALSALAAQNLPRAHERLQKILTLNPPENIRTIIARQLQDIEQQMGGTAKGTAPAVTSSGRRAIVVQVEIAPNLSGNLDQRTPLFVLARDPNAPGPPLAVVRRAVGDLPLSATLTEANAMMQGHGIDSAQRVQVVARVSKSGSPQAQPGDAYGEAMVDFSRGDRIDVTIKIDRLVPAK